MRKHLLQDIDFFGKITAGTVIGTAIADFGNFMYPFRIFLRFRGAVRPTSQKQSFGGSSNYNIHSKIPRFRFCHNLGQGNIDNGGVFALRFRCAELRIQFEHPLANGRVVYRLEFGKTCRHHLTETYKVFVRNFSLLKRQTSSRLNKLMLKHNLNKWSSYYKLLIRLRNVLT